MWDNMKVDDYLRNNLSESRYIHSINVSKTSIKLAKIYGCDIDKARLAGLIHDCGKNLNNDEIRYYLNKHSIVFDESYKSNMQIYHGAAGAVISKEVMGIKDDEIYNAIRYHTTGREDMILLEKIVYIADYIEPGRNFPGVEQLRESAFKNINDALLLSFNNTINHVISKGDLIHLDTVKARNFILQNTR